MCVYFTGHLRVALQCTTEIVCASVCVYIYIYIYIYIMQLESNSTWLNCHNFISVENIITLHLIRWLHIFNLRLENSKHGLPSIYEYGKKKSTPTVFGFWLDITEIIYIYIYIYIHTYIYIYTYTHKNLWNEWLKIHYVIISYIYSISKTIDFKNSPLCSLIINVWTNCRLQ